MTPDDWQLDVLDAVLRVAQGIGVIAIVVSLLLILTAYQRDK